MGGVRGKDQITMEGWIEGRQEEEAESARAISNTKQSMLPATDADTWLPG